MDLQHMLPGNSHNPDTANMSFENSWKQVPPSIMPWTVQNRPQLVRFGDTSGESDPWNTPRPKFKFIKRKSDLDFDSMPAKMHITEDILAAHLKDMHLSNDYVGGQVSCDGLDKAAQADGMLPSLVLSKEVQNLSALQDRFIPESLIPKLEKRTQALVLWKPPGGNLAQILWNLYNAKGKGALNVNNNSATPDLNTMTSSRSASPNTEMEL